MVEGKRKSQNNKVLLLVKTRQLSQLPLTMGIKEGLLGDKYLLGIQSVNWVFKANNIAKLQIPLRSQGFSHQNSVWSGSECLMGQPRTNCFRALVWAKQICLCHQASNLPSAPVIYGTAFSNLNGLHLKAPLTLHCNLLLSSPWLGWLKTKQHTFSGVQWLYSIKQLPERKTHKLASARGHTFCLRIP